MKALIESYLAENFYQTTFRMRAQRPISNNSNFIPEPLRLAMGALGSMKEIGKIKALSDSLVVATPTFRSRLDHHGNMGDGWDEQDWLKSYVKPLLDSFDSAFRRKGGDAKMRKAIWVEIDEKGYVNVGIDNLSSYKSETFGRSEMESLIKSKLSNIKIDNVSERGSAVMADVFILNSNGNKVQMLQVTYDTITDETEFAYASKTWGGTGKNAARVWRIYRAPGAPSEHDDYWKDVRMVASGSKHYHKIMSNDSFRQRK